MGNTAFNSCKDQFKKKKKKDEQDGDGNIQNNEENTYNTQKNNKKKQQTVIPENNNNKKQQISAEDDKEKKMKKSLTKKETIMIENSIDKYFDKEEIIYYDQLGYKDIFFEDGGYNLQNNNSSQSENKNFKWKAGKQLGFGSFGRVVQGINIHTGELMAVKQIPFGEDKALMMETLETEVKMLTNLQHKNIVRYIRTSRQKDHLNIFFEYIAGCLFCNNFQTANWGSIQSLLQKYGKFSDNLIRLYTKQILEGLEYLHSHKVIHRDIKGANVLVDQNGVCKLADFGTAKIIAANCNENNVNSLRGTANWMAPEVIKEQSSGRYQDIWSIGCTVLEMATGKPPWHSQYSNPLSIMFQIAQMNTKPQLPDDISPEVKEFIYCCIEIEPTKRLNVYKLLRHPFLQEKKTNIPQQINGGNQDQSQNKVNNNNNNKKKTFQPVSTIEQLSSHNKLNQTRSKSDSQNNLLFQTEDGVILQSPSITGHAKELILQQEIIKNKNQQPLEGDQFFNDLKQLNQDHRKKNSIKSDVFIFYDCDNDTVAEEKKQQDKNKYIVDDQDEKSSHMSIENHLCYKKSAFSNERNGTNLSNGNGNNNLHNQSYDDVIQQKQPEDNNKLQAVYNDLLNQSYEEDNKKKNNLQFSSHIYDFQFSEVGQQQSSELICEQKFKSAYEYNDNKNNESQNIGAILMNKQHSLNICQSPEKNSQSNGKIMHSGSLKINDKQIENKQNDSFDSDENSAAREAIKQKNILLKSNYYTTTQNQQSLQE